MELEDGEVDEDSDGGDGASSVGEVAAAAAVSAAPAPRMDLSSSGSVRPYSHTHVAWISEGDRGA